jgi:hypothetical protein
VRQFYQSTIGSQAARIGWQVLLIEG